MRPDEMTPAGSANRVAPHQSEFVDRFVAPGASRVFQLVAPPGTGKTRALALTIQRKLEREPNARVIYLTQASLTALVVEELQQMGVAADKIDRFRFRELLDANWEESLWPRGTVSVVSLDFARQSDVLEALCATVWALGVADETGSFKGTRGHAIARVASSATRFIFTARQENIESLPALLSDRAIVAWSLPDLLSRLEVREVVYSESEAEGELRAQVEAIRDVLQEIRGPWAGLAKYLECAMWSSPLALERKLTGLGRQGAALAGIEQETAVNAQSKRPGKDEARPGLYSTETVAELARAALRQLEAVTSDSKLDAFRGELIRGLAQPAIQSNAVVVVAFQATAFYLEQAIEELGLQEFTIHGSLSRGDRNGRVQEFESSGGVLVTTTAAAEGLEVLGRARVVFYDIPRTQQALDRLLFPLKVSSRPGPTEIFALVPSGAEESQPPRGLRALRRACRGTNE